MDSNRKNTLVVDFSVLPSHPNTTEVHKFLVHQIKLDVSQVKNLQLHTIRKQALIELNSLEVAQDLAAAHNLKHSMQAENKNFLIPVFLEDTSTTVRVHDLPPDMPNVDVANYMKQFGVVKSVVRELWKKYFPGTPNGVRVVRIELQKHIPSYIKIHDQMSMVSYRNQPTTCRNCGQRSHPNIKCSEVTKATKKNTTAGPLQPKSTAGSAQTLRPTSNNKNSEADNRKEIARETKRKRDRSIDAQLTGMDTHEYAAEEPEREEMQGNEWIVYTNKKLDRIIENNKKLLEKCDSVIKRK